MNQQQQVWPDEAQRMAARADAIRVENTAGEQVARAGFVLNMVWRDGEAPLVRQRFWRAWDVLLAACPQAQMVWWHRGLPCRLLDKRAQKELAMLRTHSDDPYTTVSVTLASIEPGQQLDGKPFWTAQAQAWWLRVDLPDYGEMWFRDRYVQPGVGPALSVLRFAAPATWLTEQGEAAVARVCQAAEALQPLWATAGWGLVPNPRESLSHYTEDMQRIAPYLQRYPELDAINSTALGEHGFNQAMGRPGWLNILGADLLARLGGREALLAKAAETPGLSAYALGEQCCVLRVGDWPTLSDADAAETPPTALATVAQWLKPVRATAVANLFVCPPGVQMPDDAHWRQASARFMARLDDLP